LNASAPGNVPLRCERLQVVTHETRISNGNPIGFRGPRHGCADHGDDRVDHAHADEVVIIPVLDSCQLGLRQSVLGATIFVETLRSPYVFRTRGGLVFQCFQRVPLLAKWRRQTESIMSSRTRITFVVVVIAVLIASGAMLGTTVAQKASAPKAQDNVALGEGEVKKLLPLMETDNDGKVSKQEFMSFMEAEFDRLDKKKEGKLDVKELTQQPTKGFHK
jgi:hypothetical protein